MLTYKSSTFFRAQGVLRRNARLDLMLGSNLKHRMSIMLPRSSHPKCSTSSVTIISRVFPCSGSLGGIKSGIQKPNIREMMKSGIQQAGNPATRQSGNTAGQQSGNADSQSPGKLVCRQAGNLFNHPPLAPTLTQGFTRDLQNIFSWFSGFENEITRLSYFENWTLIH
jgi:hypothetical protein